MNATTTDQLKGNTLKNQTIDGVPRELLERLAKIENISRDEDNGPGRDLCPVCFGHGQWNWVQGSVISIDQIEHEADCPLAELRALLSSPEPVWNPHPDVGNLAALLIELAQHGIKVTGGNGDEPWSVEPATQPQGEPVAYQRKSKTEGAEWHYIHGCDVAEAQRLGYEVRPLYAEQPAPVGVTG